uniref:Uncharacterized protein n=1 Tax=Arundo donax TaxID=35708 RepID=A0A0A9DB70_ARUDO
MTPHSTPVKCCLPSVINSIYICSMLEDVLRGGDAVVEGGPLDRVVAQAVGLVDRPALPLHEPLQLLQIAIRRRGVHVILQRLVLRRRRRTIALRRGSGGCGRGRRDGGGDRGVL